ncbi:MAG: nitroreductase family protein [Candidatus Micrarchaeia archaeon]
MLEAMRKRRSIRNYKNETIEDEKLNDIIRAAVYAPSSANRRPVHLIVVKNEDTRRKLSRVTKWSSFIEHAPACIAVCADMKRGKRWIEDCSIAATHIMLQAEEEGIGSCWVQVREGERDDGADPEKIVKDILNMPENSLHNRSRKAEEKSPSSQRRRL